jgi:hypothetical protein
MVGRWTDEIPPSGSDAENNAGTRDPCTVTIRQYRLLPPSIGVTTVR